MLDALRSMMEAQAVGTGQAIAQRSAGRASGVAGAAGGGVTGKSRWEGRCRGVLGGLAGVRRGGGAGAVATRCVVGLSRRTYDRSSASPRFSGSGLSRSLRSLARTDASEGARRGLVRCAGGKTTIAGSVGVGSFFYSGETVFDGVQGAVVFTVQLVDQCGSETLARGGCSRPGGRGRRACGASVCRAPRSPRVWRGLSGLLCVVGVTDRPLWLVGDRREARRASRDLPTGAAGRGPP